MRRPIRPLPAHGAGTRDEVIDAALTATIVVVGQVVAWSGQVFEGPRGVNALLVAGMGVVLWWRRTHPMAVLVAVVGLVTVQSLLFGAAETAATLLPLMVAAYSAAAFGGPAYLVISIMALALAVQVSTDPLITELSQALWSPVVFGVLLALGFVSGHRRGQAGEAAARAERIHAERDRALAEAVEAERRRIAREMHDLVAHGVSIMALQASAAEAALDRDHERVRAALMLIRETGHEVVRELGQIVALLREDHDPDASHLPSLTSLDALLERLSGAGLDVTIHTHGTPIPLDPGTEIAVFRIIQEALTNALNHGGGDHVDVALDWGADSLQLTVVNPRSAPDRAWAGTGKGMAGIAERVAFARGKWDAGPTPDGLWRLHAELPARDVTDAGTSVPA